MPKRHLRVVRGRVNGHACLLCQLSIGEAARAAPMIPFASSRWPGSWSCATWSWTWSRSSTSSTRGRVADPQSAD